MNQIGSGSRSRPTTGSFISNVVDPCVSDGDNSIRRSSAGIGSATEGVGYVTVMAVLAAASGRSTVTVTGMGVPASMCVSSTATDTVALAAVDRIRLTAATCTARSHAVIATAPTAGTIDPDSGASPANVTTNVAVVQSCRVESMLY